MTTTPDGISQRDRDSATKIVEEACKAGLIIPADRDQRVQQVKNAQTHAELDLALGNLKERMNAPETPQVLTSTPPMPVPEPLGDTSPKLRLPFAAIVGGLATVVVGIAGVVFLVSLLSGVGDDSNPKSGTATPPAEEPGKSAVLSGPGISKLLDAIKERTGSTFVFDATMYPTYAVLELPEDRETRRERSYYWDGKKLEANDSFGKSSYPRFDLATVDANGLLALSRRVRGIVDEPTSYYVIVRAPDESDGAVIYAYASNKYSEGAYLSADARGKVIRKVTW